MAKHRLFLIEDEELLCELFTDYAVTIPEIEFLGFENDGLTGVEKAIELKPDIVVLDMRLPRTNGIEALHRLRKELGDIKIIIFTGTVKEETVHLAYSQGADAFVEKALGLAYLKEAILAVILGERYVTEGISAILKSFKTESEQT
jgi:DNA-binding NarL/FixJ family response regulator|tara:strand:+ start:1116 stop:1553 length:438 start_codon:yes stop_codon:yes gene_type:complete